MKKIYHQINNQGGQNKSQYIQRSFSRNPKQSSQTLYQGKRSVDCDKINVLSSSSKPKEEPQSSQVTNEKLMYELQRGMSSHSKQDQSFIQNMSNSIKPFSSTHEFDFGSIHQKKMKNTVMSQRSCSNNSSVYENVLHSPKIGKMKPMTRLEYLIGRKVGNRSPGHYEVVADVLEHGISVNMSRG